MPGTFLERLNTQKFATLLEVLVKQVNEIMEQHGPPLCIIGVNSSPTCGVTSTYYGSESDEPPKRIGRGVFLSRFPEIHALDVTIFARYRVYLAAPLFSEAERSYNFSVTGLLRKNLFEVFLPQEAGDDPDTRSREEQMKIFSQNRNAIENADIIVAIIDGADADSGTAWEMGYAHALGKQIIAVRTDFRRTGTHERVNLMLEESAIVVSSTEQLLGAIHAPGVVKSGR